MAKKRFKQQPSKYENEAILLTSTVQRIEVQNIEINGKFKTVFYCKSHDKPEGQSCVYWGRTTFKAGSRFNAKGRFTPDGTFLVWSMMHFIDKEQGWIIF